MRPAVSEKRLSLTGDGRIRYELKTPYRDGTTQVFFEPLDFLARLAALATKPRGNLTSFHGVSVPNSKRGYRLRPLKEAKAANGSLEKKYNADHLQSVEHL